MELPLQASRTHSRPIRFEQSVHSYLSGMCGRSFELVRPDSLSMEGWRLLQRGSRKSRAGSRLMMLTALSNMLRMTMLQLRRSKNLKSSVHWKPRLQ
ncbi:hypothetical protein JG688_00018412 [Phytophthora aleatoria]|uniref:Uncharacterized protein n=1 Tax=Phytophthora aleatoria TaxID=2496075 RepID=A0A8J5I8S6_9STRA|nr:hypothetical protein JG688_00018412 [Phytophthora aleatoria]